MRPGIVPCRTCEGNTSTLTHRAFPFLAQDRSTGVPPVSRRGILPLHPAKSRAGRPCYFPKTAPNQGEGEIQNAACYNAAMIWRAVILAACAAAGCAPATGPVELNTRGVTPRVDYSNLAVVLKECVDPQGQVLPEILDRYAHRLDVQLKLMAVTGPTKTPAFFTTQDDRLAYWYNAAAAWSMKLALAAKFPEEMNEPELHRRAFPLDGGKMTLHEIHDLLRKDADFRVALLVPCVCVREGPLPATPLTGADFRRRIDEAFNRYVADPKRLVIDVENRCILFPPGLWRVRDRLIGQYEKTYGMRGRDALDRPDAARSRPGAAKAPGRHRLSRDAGAADRPAGAAREVQLSKEALW